MESRLKFAFLRDKKCLGSLQEEKGTSKATISNSLLDKVRHFIFL